MEIYEPTWQKAIPTAWLHSNQIHVWRVSLEISDMQRGRLLDILSADEVAKATRFHFEKDQNRFIAARGVLRQILGHYLAVAPHSIRFEYTTFGKPFLMTGMGDGALRFNLSHAGSFALYAITRDRNIGIDIEQIREDVAVEPIVQRFFAPEEVRSMEQRCAQTKQALFFQYWTRKEAFLKAIGAGVSFPMELCDVSSVSGKSFSPITLLGEKRNDSCWSARDLNPGHGYAAAIAVEGGDGALSCWHYTV